MPRPKSPYRLVLQQNKEPMLRTKKFRASDGEWEAFLSFLSGDARKDFLQILDALTMLYHETKRKINDR